MPGDEGEPIVLLRMAGAAGGGEQEHRGCQPGEEMFLFSLAAVWLAADRC